jgi:N-acetylglutamate synthase-like GNAT family acetyltransferase
MINFTLRAARASDLGAIRKLIYRVGINPTGLNWKRFVVAANSKDKILGCGQIKPHGGDILELASIAVRPEVRNMGVARAIIERLLADNPRPLYLTCRSRFGSLYEKFGFSVLSSDEMPRYFMRISRLAGLVELLIRDGDILLVMKLE